MSKQTESLPLMRVPMFLQDEEVPFQTIIHRPAFTAQKRAHFLHVPGRYVAKSVLLIAGRRRILAVLPATHHVQFEALAPLFGERPRLAEETEMQALFRDCEWGVSGPFGRLYGISTIMDTSFGSNDPIVFEAHLHVLAIRMQCRDFERLEKPKRLSFARRLL